MMAKCSQKQIPKPQYNDFGYGNYDLYEKKTEEYYVEFASNKYYPELKNNYSNTKFYQEALSRCSYLSDFVRK
ncbi:hypothetical protein [Niabella ginsengisoli]|uniref:Uncharacterized protein n=1 Tax=Niabella ginsengisoli TaxID=522298 RepID=A0ABS9SNC3_9BACT|nr:hypothetical protein [Niabella ginsengisoli]MCH5599838.1 hypothetical protein [Niabella ginsengisoli]